MSTAQMSRQHQEVFESGFELFLKAADDNSDTVTVSLTQKEIMAIGIAALGMNGLEPELTSYLNRVAEKFADAISEQKL